VRTATSEDRPFALEYRIVRADGEVAWVLERGQRVVEADGQVWLDGVIFDITERKRAEGVLRAREAEQVRIAELKAARARIVAAEDKTRRQIERDLHDGAPQPLVALAVTLRMIKAKLLDDPETASGLLGEAIARLAEATAELRKLARGIYPAMLTERGLSAAIPALGSRTAVPVDVDSSLSERLPGPIEVAAYYAVAESPTNVARYSRATRATVRLRQQDGCAVVEVEDDGIRGVNLESGSGIRGLIDRIEALDGSFDVRHRAGQRNPDPGQDPARLGWRRTGGALNSIVSATNRVAFSRSRLHNAGSGHVLHAERAVAGGGRSSSVLGRLVV
jgi:signal transduction histidine kinase